MHYITDYQLDINNGFQCKVNEKLFEIQFNESCDCRHWFITDPFRKLLIELELNPDVAVRPHGKFKDNNLCYCNSKQQCYNLCQHIVDTYFQPTDISKETKKYCEKSRRYLLKYYNPTQNIVMFPNKNFYLDKWNNEGHWFWRNITIGAPALYEQFKLTLNQVLVICKNLNLLAYFYSNILIFENTTDAIKFTDYLIETYIIKKEKTYENQLRKERTSLSRGAKPAGSIIHGRRSKASIRCRHIEYKARIGC